MIFLSTPSARRATRSPLIIFTAIGNFYPRPPRGGRPCCQGRQALHQDISIHALREEGDIRFSLISSPPQISIHALREEGDSRTHTTLCRQHNFYPRPPRGGRRHLVHLLDGGIDISIHALREEGDRSWSLPFGWSGHFYPRPPRGGRHVVVDERLTGQGISIHALREEGDRTRARQRSLSGRFLSTPSARRATRMIGFPATPTKYFYPRPPRGGRR